VTDDRQTDHATKKCVAIGAIITEWNELSLCEAVRLSQDRASWSKTAFGPNGI